MEKNNYIPQTIHLQSSSPKEYFLIHGYTSAPTDFNELPNYLHRKYNANVKIILLKGHGTKIEDLDNVTYHDLVSQIEYELKKDLASGKEIIIGGVSFGAQVALYLAAKYSVSGVLVVGIPYKLIIPFNMPKLEYIGAVKKYWKKPLPPNLKVLREKSFYYSYMHANGLKIIKQANRDVSSALPKIKSPVLFIHSRKDPIAHCKSVNLIDKQLYGVRTKKIFFNEFNHNIFFSHHSLNINKEIGSFFDPTLESAARPKHVAAIIPTFNEGNRINNVLEVLTNTSILDEIIVIDDGSTDGTASVVEKFPNVKLLRNGVNKGKAYSMQRGVDATKSSIIFFCDADLVGLTPDIVESIIEPVINKKYVMFIGVRDNVIQKAVTLFALNSGERALRREVWEQLPERFKYRYRIEVGLNLMAKKLGGYNWQKFDYYQTIKEKKYGFMKGTLLRWWMNIDVFVAYSFTLVDTIRSKKHNS